ncbi:MAG: hypothetical protein HQL35_03180 [Alphaproteobacteria bacterium]|nr:hypothetical protein [Alphaproteobacteria bacterium]
MAEFPIPDGAHHEPGPCPRCGADAPVVSVRTKTDRNWWEEWKGCMGCVTPAIYMTQFLDRHGEYTIAVPGGPEPRDVRRKRRKT